MEKELAISDLLQEVAELKNRLASYEKPVPAKKYSEHLVRLYAGDWDRLKKFYSKPTRAIRSLVSNYIKEAEKGSD